MERLVQRLEVREQRVEVENALVRIGVPAVAAVASRLEARATAGRSVAAELSVLERIGPGAAPCVGALRRSLKAMSAPDLARCAHTMASITPFGPWPEQELLFDQLRREVKMRVTESDVPLALGLMMNLELARCLERGSIEVRDVTLEYLKGHLDSQRMHVRVVAAQALARRDDLADSEKLRLLGSALRRASVVERSKWLETGSDRDDFEVTVAEEMVRLRPGDPGGEQLLELAFGTLAQRHEDPVVRARAARELGACRTKEGLDALATACRDPDTDVALTAIEVLGKRGRAARPKKWVLLELLHHRNPVIAEAAGRSCVLMERSAGK